MKIIALALVVFVILSTSFPAPNKAADSGDSGDSGNVGVVCDAKQLQPCLSAITGGGQPSGDCCAKLKEEQPCLCGFIKNPAFAQYISSPNSRKVLAACGVTYPTC